MTDNELRWLAYADWMEEKGQARSAQAARDSLRAMKFLGTMIPAPVYDASLNEWVWMNVPPEDRP